MASEKVDNQARNKCEEERDHCLQYNVRVMYLIDSMERMGCKLGDPKKFITCAPLADGQRSGGFQTDSNAEPHIYLAEDASLKAGHGRTQMAHTLTHELVHAFDQCRAHANWSNLVHQACSEIRASSLSGECDYAEEFNRNPMAKFAGGHSACVRRRAELSVAMNLARDEKEKAAEAVQAAFGRCYNDTAPFRRHLN
mmetsp:Transcript_89853/g.256902  ORF Transcript_89853/g.256902 Transcript_89853/m.256902 type:complete len:197 (-) Transcript_89853:37-627(-)